MDKFKCLVFSFFREEPEIQIILRPLLECTLSRGGGSVFIDCLDHSHLEQIRSILGYLKTPFSELKLGKQIVLRSPDSIDQIYRIPFLSHSDLLA